MTQRAVDGLYGLTRPRLYVRWRGYLWLRSGFCPNCYSSPPAAQCIICEGDFVYGSTLTKNKQRQWRWKWKLMTTRSAWKRRKEIARDHQKA